MSSQDAQYLLSKHTSLLEQTKSLVDQAISQDNKYLKSFQLLLQKRLETHHRWLVTGGDQKNNDLLNQWGPITVLRVPVEAQNGSTKLRITGPATGDIHIIAVAGDGFEASVTSAIKEYDKMSRILHRAVEQTTLYFELRRMADDQSDSSRVDHMDINLLKQYTAVRDVGHKLIGVIAENRAVPIRSLYADGTFGVGPDD